MVKLIMTDIDGTLIPDGTMDINPEYFEVIEKLVERNKEVFLMTGLKWFAGGKERREQAVAIIDEVIETIGDKYHMILVSKTLYQNQDFEDWTSWIQLSVSDTGIGISEQDLKTLFHP